MKKYSIDLLIIPISGLILISCAQNKSSGNPESWTGKYGYSEQPIKALAGYNMMMIWDLSITKEKNGYQGILEVNGQQTYFKLLTDISGDTNSIAITFNKVIDGSDENLKTGDTLFLLLKNENEIKTRWMSLNPRLRENPPKECTCFEKE